MAPNTVTTGEPQRARAARVLAMGVDAALVAGALATEARTFECSPAGDAVDAVRQARARPVDLVVVGGPAEEVAHALEALTAAPAMGRAALVAWRADATGSEVAHLTAMGAVVALASPESLRRACIEALVQREANDARAQDAAGCHDTSAGAGSEQVELSGRRVVVADDDPAIAWYFADVLRLAGCEVDEAADGAAALDAARRNVPDVVFSDVRMPRLNGVRLCKAMRADPVLADIPVVLLSWRKDWLPDACRDARATGSLIKHATPEEVLACVRAALAKHTALERQLRKTAATRGSLEGISPYRILRSVCEARRDARVTFRDPAWTWEIRVHEGAPRSAMRVASDGAVANGEEALVSSLCARAGRFSVVSDGSPGERELRGSFYEQIAAHVAASRGFASARASEAEPTIPMSLPVDGAVDSDAPGFELPRASATLVELPVRTVPMARRPLPALRETTLRLVFPTLRLPRRPVDAHHAASKNRRVQAASATKPPAASDGRASRKRTIRWAVLGTVLLVGLALGQSGGGPPTPDATTPPSQATGASARRTAEATGVDGTGGVASPPPAARAMRTNNPARPR
jgi:CheY-like chemotaxis protein